MTTLVATSGLSKDHDTYFYLSRGHTLSLHISCIEIGKRVAKYHWDDRGKLYEDYVFLKELYGKILSELFIKLNEIHGTSYSERYWRILVGPWLLYYLQITFDRWEMVRIATQQIKPKLIIVCPALDDANYLPIGMTDFRKMYIDQAWNDNLFREILIHLDKFELNEIGKNSSIFENKIIASNIVIPIIKKIKISIKNFMIACFASANRPILLETGLSVVEEFKLSCALGFIQFPIPEFAQTKQSFESSVRSDIFSSSSCKSEFEIFAKKMIAKNIPTNYLEGYQYLCKNILALPWPKDPKFIFTSYAYNANDHFKVWAASKADTGVPLIIGQHGGNLGTAKFTSTEDHEVDISDQYLTWGWTDSKRRCMPVGMLKKINKQRTNFTQQQDLLLISSVFPRYSYVLGSYPIGENQVIKNLSDQKVFISGLTIEVFDKVLMRLFQPDWGWSQTEYWREAYPSLRLNNGNGYLGKLINQAKLCVITYNATTFLEVLSQNIPTIAFWDPGNWELREEAIQLFDGLRRAGILWSNPMDAAEKVNQIWGDVEKWWLQPLIQEARLAFCSKYAKRPNDMIKDCKKSLLAAKGFRS